MRNVLVILAVVAAVALLLQRQSQSQRNAPLLALPVPAPTGNAPQSSLRPSDLGPLGPLLSLVVDSRVPQLASPQEAPYSNEEAWGTVQLVLDRLRKRGGPALDLIGVDYVSKTVDAYKTSELVLRFTVYEPIGNFASTLVAAVITEADGGVTVRELKTFNAAADQGGPVAGGLEDTHARFDF